MNVQRRIAPRPDDPSLQLSVERPPAGLPGAVILLLAAIGAIILFLILDAGRRSTEGAKVVYNDEAAFVPAPPLQVPIPVNDQAAPVITVPQRAMPMASPPAPIVAPAPAISRPSAAAPQDVYEPASPPLLSIPPPPPPSISANNFPQESDGLGGSALVIDSGAGSGQETAVRAGMDSELDSGLKKARLARLANPASTIATGTLIPAVLETPIDTSKPGLVRAIVSKDVRGVDGRRVLIPRGSKLIGEYQSDVAWSQRRVQVTWTTLIRPDNSTIELAFPAADALGATGVPGRLGGSPIGRFLGGVLQSAFTVGESFLTQRVNNTVVVGVPAGAVAGASPNIMISNSGRRTLTVKRGSLVNAFVARDLDLSEPAA